MQEIAFPGFKFQKFSGDYPSNKSMINSRLIFFLLFVSFFYFKYKYS
jgi:hypothetical protein